MSCSGNKTERSQDKEGPTTHGTWWLWEGCDSAAWQQDTRRAAVLRPEWASQSIGDLKHRNGTTQSSESDGQKAQGLTMSHCLT